MTGPDDAPARPHSRSHPRLPPQTPAHRHTHGDSRSRPGGHAHGHAHGHGKPPPASARLRRVITAVIVPFAAAIGIGLVLLWPGGAPEKEGHSGIGFDQQTEHARVTAVTDVACEDIGVQVPQGMAGPCQEATVEITTGPHAGRTYTEIVPPDATRSYHEGQDVIVAYAPDAPAELQYSITDVDRQAPMLLLAAVFALAVVAVLVVVLVIKPGDSTDPGVGDTPADLLAQAPDAKADAGCDDVQTIGFYDGVNDPQSPDYTDQAHIGAEGSAFPVMPPLTSYPSQPPVSGPHANIPPGPAPAEQGAR